MEFIENLRTIEEILKNSSFNNVKTKATIYHIEKISSRIKDIIFEAKKKGVSILEINQKEMMRYSQKKNVPVVMVLENGYFRNFLTVQKFIEDTKDSDEPKLVLVIDKVVDPQNLGNIFRSCELFGVDLVILPKRNSAQVNDTVKNVSVGGTEYVKHITTANLKSEIDLLIDAGYWTYSSQVSGERLYDIEFKDKVCLIIGSEQKGVSQLISKNSDYTITIPTIGKLDSFNVASATAIMMYQIRYVQGII